MVKARLHPEHDVRYYWHNRMWASFMVDGLGLRQINEIGWTR
jgi:hypothetical protein